MTNMISRTPPVIAVVTVVLNDNEGLAVTRRSLEEQSYTNWLHIIVDGNSSDGTYEYAQRLDSQNTILIHENDEGIYFAMNKGWVLAPEGSVVFFINAGDRFAYPYSLAICAHKFLNSTNKWGCTTHQEYDSHLGTTYSKLVSKPNPRNQLYAVGYRSHQAVVFKKDFLRELNGFNEAFTVAADWDLIVRAMLKSKPIEWVVPLAQFTLGGFSSSNMKIAHEELKTLREIYLNLTVREKFWDYVYRSIWLEPTLYMTKLSLLLNFASVLTKKIRKNDDARKIKAMPFLSKEKITRSMDRHQTFILPFILFCFSCASRIASRIYTQFIPKLFRSNLRRNFLTFLDYPKLTFVRWFIAKFSKLKQRIRDRKLILIPVLFRVTVQTLDFFKAITQPSFWLVYFRNCLFKNLKLLPSDSQRMKYLTDLRELQSEGLQLP